MKYVSTSYKDEMKKLLRGRSFCKVSFSNINTEMSHEGEWESDGSEEYSEVATLDYNYSYGDTIAALELNRWAMDGKSIILPDVPWNDGFVSSHLSNNEGVYLSSPAIDRVFDSAHNLPGLTIKFDSREGEHPLNVTVVFYLEGDIVGYVTTDVESTTLEIDKHFDAVDEIKVIFNSMLPYRKPRVEYIMFGLELIFGNNELVHTHQAHDVDPLSRRLPDENFEFTILDFEKYYDPDNPQGIYTYIDKNSPVKIQFGYELDDGTVEWVKADRYVLSAKPSVKDLQATFKGTGLVGSLTKTYYKDTLGEKNFYDMAESVLMDADLPLTEEGQNPWEIDESLQEMYTTACLPIDTHMNCLQMIAHACRCRLFTDDDNIIHIKPFGVTVTGIYKGDFSDNGHVWYSEEETLDRGHKTENEYAALELNRWTLDGGNQIIINDENPSGRGYIGTPLSDENGEFEDNPIITRTFDVSHDLSVIALKFDTLLKQYPLSFKINYYREETLLDTQEVSEIYSPEVFVYSQLAIDCTKIEIEFTKVLPYSRPRLHKVYYRETDFTLDFTSVSENTQSITKIEALKSISVAKYSYIGDGNPTSLYEGSTNENQLHIEFSGVAQNVEISVEGGTLISSEIYGRAADLIMGDGLKTIVITGEILTENSIVVTYPIASEGETDEEKNPLITNDTMCSALANWVAAYLKLRNTYDADYRGNPEIEVGDIIGLQTHFTDEMDALVLTDEIEFNGALSGKMKVKGLI